MSELDARGRALRVDEIDDRGQGVTLGVVPQAKILRRDPALRGDAGSFDDDRARPAAGQTPVVHVVPGRGDAIVSLDGILAHGRHPDAVAHGETAQSDRFEQQM